MPKAFDGLLEVLAADLKATFDLPTRSDVGVEKVRAFEGARRALWLEPGDPRILDRPRRFAELAPERRRPAGVFRFATIEDAERRR